MWFSFALLSTLLVGFYDVAKKQSLTGNAVIPILLINTLLSSLIFLPFVIYSAWRPDVMNLHPLVFVPSANWREHCMILVKSAIILSSWLFAYAGIKHLPITIIGPINAARPGIVLVGAMMLYGERLNLYQWVGVVLSMAAFLALSRSGKKEGIDFRSNRWVMCIVVAALLGGAGTLYDKFLMHHLDRMFIQSWNNFYQLGMMAVITLVVWYPKRAESPLQWRWSIPLISVFLSAADFAAFYALSLEGSMISIITMIRPGSAIISFILGAILFREKNLRSKAVALAIMLVGILFLYWGSK